ncbi:MAG: glutamate formimidoyltransferase [Candidatus Acetothermia bacterium]|jgi:glutamate formiminotransferase|nr:glutamate formimidoyltransferase [Candidatus Acetothermia bacterium]MDH7506101.1 glutamate formimidoyltransferase [Candidatus Acetothermia bacterium]
MKLIEAVPNISEGRDREKIEAIVAAVRAVRGAALLDVDPDPDHNRTVITFAGPLEAVEEAALRLTAKAVELIDLSNHRGEHPRMGAVDVLPFVPLRGATMAECVELARRVGQRISEEFKVPVYLYAEAATRPERQDLANIRRGEFEGFPAKIQEPEWAPDFGERRVHPTAGVMAVGARPPLIAYNVNLGTNDLEVAKRIAQAVRGSSGGLRYVKALAFELEERGLVQVSMNLVDYRKTPLHRAFELVKREAARYGVPVVGSEIVGLVPQEALNMAAEYYLQLEHFRSEMILEERLAQALGEVEAH